jgi:hypothetical protein
MEELSKLVETRGDPRRDPPVSVMSERPLTQPSPFEMQKGDLRVINLLRPEGVALLP